MASLQSYAATDYKKWLDLVNQEQAKTNAAGIAATQNVYGGTHTYDTSGRNGDNSRPVAAGTSGADEFWMSDQDYDQLLQYKQDYASATDQAGRDAAHAAAEALRARYNYSGGTDGSMYLNSAYQTALFGGGDDEGGYGGTGGGAGGYNSQYSSMIDGLLGGILNREPFSYNKDTDDLYQQYKESYTRGGQRAMQDVLAQISARTGGMASSYGTSASQQTFNNYMAELADKVPELYQMRYNMYLDELNQKRQDLDTVLGIDDMYYGRYRDTVGDQQWQQQFDYNAYRDSVADSQWQTQWDYGVQSDSQSAAQAQVDAILQAGGTPSAALLAQAGYSSEYAAALGSYYNRGSSTPGYTPVGDDGIGDVYQWLYNNGATDYGTAYQMLRNAGYNTTDANRYASYFTEGWSAPEVEPSLNDLNTASVAALGVGMLDYGEISRMTNAGMLTTYDAGDKVGVKWAPGWDAERYKSSGSTDPLLGYLR